MSRRPRKQVMSEANQMAVEAAAAAARRGNRRGHVEDSTPRQPRSRKVLASSRRETAASRQQSHQSPDDKEDYGNMVFDNEETSDADIGRDGRASTGRGRVDAVGYRSVRIGRDGRFVSSNYSSSSRQQSHQSPYDEEDYGNMVFDNEETSDADIGRDGRASTGRGRVDAFRYRSVRIGRHGRFVSSEHSSSSTVDSRRRKKKTDDSWIVKGWVDGGPVVGDVIPSFCGHIASEIWHGKDRKVLKCQNRKSAAKILEEWRGSMMTGNMVSRIDATSLSHLPSCIFSHIDWALISAFVERWQPDTNSFHLPFGEMTIMLHDVLQILRIPIEGRMVIEQESSDDLKYYVAELLGLPFEQLGSDSSHWSDGGVFIDSIDYGCRLAQPPRAEETQITAYLFLLLGCTLFPDKSGNRVRPHDIVEARQPEHMHEYSWGSAALAYLYRHLGISSRIDGSGLTGCLTLLQSWIYEYFPLFRPQRDCNAITVGLPRALMWSIRPESKTEERLRYIRRRLDMLTPSEVDWLPYGPDPSGDALRTTFFGYLRYRDIIEPYMPDRVVRQLGYVQTVPRPIHRPNHAYRGRDAVKYEVQFSAMAAESVWDVYPVGSRLHLVEYVPSSHPLACSDDYMDWYQHHSHPLLIPYVHQDDNRLPDRTSTEQWVGRAIRLAQPFLDARDQLPQSMSDSCAAWDQFIHDWNTVLGIRDSETENANQEQQG